MAAIVPIVINDGLATPVAHTFSPYKVGETAGLFSAEYEDRIGGIYVGMPRLHLTMKRPTSDRRTVRVGVKVMAPILEVLSNSTVSGIMPAPTVAYTPLFEGTFVIPERSTIAARRDILAYVTNMLANPTVVSAVRDLEMPF